MTARRYPKDSFSSNSNTPAASLLPATPTSPLQQPAVQSQQHAFAPFVPGVQGNAPASPVAPSTPVQQPRQPSPQPFVPALAFSGSSASVNSASTAQQPPIQSASAQQVPLPPVATPQFDTQLNCPARYMHMTINAIPATTQIAKAIPLGCIVHPIIPNDEVSFQ